MPELRLIVIDPGHFHAALVQKEMYSAVSPRVRVVAPLGPDLVDYVARIARFNRRADMPTSWRLDIEACPDFLESLHREEPGGVAILSGRNGVKIERITAALEAGLHVLADKPAIIRHEDLPRLEAALDMAATHRLVVADMMTGRHDVVARLIRMLRDDPELFGEPVAGSRDEPGVALRSVHHLMKTVAGVPNPRPAWFFDIAEQGEGLTDTAVHLVDRAHQTLFPDRALDRNNDIDIVAAERWPTIVSRAQFCQLTGESGWPDALLPWVNRDALDYFCNGRADYRVRGIHVRLDVRWDWQAEHGDDTHAALYRGSRASIELRQGAAEDYRPEIYVVPQAEIAAALERRVAAAQAEFPGIAAEPRGGEWRIVVPPSLRVGHEAHFAQFTRRFLAHVADPGALPARETPNLLARYYVCTAAAAMSRR